VSSLLQGIPPRLSSGQRRVDWVYVDDVVEALASSSVPENNVAGRIMDIGSGSLTSIRSVVEELTAIIEASVVPEFGALPDRTLESQQAAEVSDARRWLGWSPTVSLSDGLRRTVEWFRAQEIPV
jgi:UDP-glucose 4-epimerase